jgi:hypothetical protein
MHQEIASAINRALLHQKAPDHILIMNAKRNARGTVTAITHQTATAAIAQIYRDVIITAGRKVDKGVIDVEQHRFGERIRIHSVPLVRYMGEGTDSLQKMRDDFTAENEGITLPIHVPGLTNPRTIR